MGLPLTILRTSAPRPEVARLAFPAEEGVLRDAQGRRITYLRVSVTDTCNFRCSYCSPANWAGRAALLTADDLVRVVRVFTKLGIDRIRLTGGEPLVRDDLLEIARGVFTLPGVREVCLTTNGHRLEELANPLVAAGVTSVNVSMDSLDPRLFRTLTKTGDVARVIRGLEAARAAGFTRLGLNAVVMGGVNDDAAGLAALVRFAWANGAVPRFIELMPFSGAGEMVSTREVVRRLETQGLSLAPADVRNGAGPASYFHGASEDGAEGDVGFIGAMTENFCDRCNRVRLSATGELRACLGGGEQVPLATLVRGGAPDEALATAIRAALLDKWDGHRFVEEGQGGLLPMMGIGG